MTLIIPIVTFGAEAWAMSSEASKRLAVFKRKVLRTISGAKKSTIAGEDDITMN
jgi:hypothetical protein